MIGLSLDLGFTFTCSICGRGTTEHLPDCPIGMLGVLSQRNTHVDCPMCGEHEIGINSDDCYECRACHSQFTAGGPVVKDRLYFLDTSGDLTPVTLMMRKGNGDFPVDKMIKEVTLLQKTSLSKLRRRRHT